MSRRFTSKYRTFTACIAKLPEPFTVADILTASPTLTMHYASATVSSFIATGVLVETGSRVGRNRSLRRSQTFVDQLTAQRFDVATPLTPGVSWADGARYLAALVPWLAA
jgi:hypothetical protein